MNLTDSKIIVMFLTGIVAFIIGMIPYMFDKGCFRTKQKISRKMGENGATTILSMLLCFGGGVLLATCFVHILPETLEGFEENLGYVWLPDMPWIEITLCCGFFTIYFLEEIIHVCLDSMLHEEHSDLERSISTESASDLSEEVRSNTDSQIAIIMTEKDTTAVHISTITPANIHSHSASHDQSHGHSHVMVTSSGESLSKFRQLVTVFALSVHAVFEGLSVGLQTTVGGVWYMYAAVASHKYVIAFCVGTELENTPKISLGMIITSLLIFCGMSPIGIGLGIAVTNIDTAAGAIAVNLLQAFAAGTLIFVVFFEIMERERSRQNVKGVFQLLAMVCGFILIIVLTGVSNDLEQDSL